MPGHGENLSGPGYAGRSKNFHEESTQSLWNGGTPLFYEEKGYGGTVPSELSRHA
jgi:hypothetical protein